MAKSKLRTPYPEEGITQWMGEAETEPQTGDPGDHQRFLAQGGIVGDSKDEYVPDVPHMDEGGIVGDFDVDTGATDTVKGLPASPQAIPPQTAAQPASTTATVQGPLPDLSTKSKPLAGIPNTPQAQDDTLNSFLGQQKAGLEKYGPEQQLAVEQALVKARTSPGVALASGAAGLGDAIMQGVARAGNPGFQEKLQNQGNQLAGEISGTMEKAQTGKMAQLKAEMELSQKDPSSPLSKIAQKAESPILKQLGWTDKQISGAAADQIGEAVKNNLSFYESEQKEALTAATIQQTGAYQQGMLKNAAAGRQQEAAKTMAGQGVGRKLLNALTPSGRAAQKTLEQQAAGGAGTFSPDVTAYASAHGITPEQAQAIKDKRTGGS